MITGEAFQRARIYRDFRPALDTADAFVDMATLIRVQELASKNNLYQNFLDHKRRQGHPIKVVDFNQNMHFAGEEYLKRGWGRAVNIHRKQLLTAPYLTSDDYSRLLTKREQGQPITDVEYNSIERYEMEFFYKTPLTQNLINLDDRGRFQEKGLLFEAMYYVPTIKLDQMDFRLTRTRGTKIVMIHQILSRVGLMTNGVVPDGIRISTADLDAFANYIIKNKAAIENTLELEVRCDVKEKPVIQLNQILKLIGLRMVAGKQVRIGNARIRRYQFDKTLTEMADIVERRKKAEDGN